MTNGIAAEIDDINPIVQKFVQQKKLLKIPVNLSDVKIQCHFFYHDFVHSILGHGI